MPSNRRVVIKVGGSLLGWKAFPARLRRYLEGRGSERFILIVGGGAAADFVRELDSTHGIGEKRSHELALRSLDLTAHVVAALVPGLVVVERPDEIGEVWAGGQVPVVASRWFLENIDRPSADPLAESWQVTTDSIAARLAVTIGAVELRLLKSVGSGGITTRAEAAAVGLVDSAFPTVSALLDTVSLVNFRDDPPTSLVLQ